ncbi:TniB family NTP-binding protein [Endozoicomonas ascidiicola]|uniref:TniB family NTP-binding protein n=1 Tax=Endozoicomonas ascidiicola TaxID=1698521 RepID=UPI00082BAD87|nr:TniB family NTP-binding protein [Endozoicomonas ascidiicola]USN27023.1 TniB family NTP-binding protein [synthetic construct]
MMNIEKEIYYNCFIPTSRIVDVINDMIKCKKSFDTKMEPISMMIMAGSGYGKTLLINYFSSKYPPVTEKNDKGEQDKKEVLVVTLRSNSTKKDAATEMLKALGDPNPDKGSLLQQTDRILTLLCLCGVKVIIIDEFSHIVQSNSSRVLGKTADWIKDIIKPPKDNPKECPKIPLIAVGMYSSIKILQSNPQLDTLVTKKSYLFPYGISQKDELDFYKIFLSNVGNKIKNLGLEIDLEDPEIYLRLFAASNGIPRLLMKIISCACGIGCSRGDNKIVDVSCFENGFEDVFGKQKKNPFKATSLKDIPFTESTTYTTWVESKCSHAVLEGKNNGLLDVVFKTGKSKGFI